MSLSILRLPLCVTLLTLPLPVLAQTPLTVKLTGLGLGSVVSAPAGIDCGNRCSANFAYGRSVTLTAMPDPGRDSKGASDFIGWSGACAGSAVTCTVDIDQARTVTAVFGTYSSQGIATTKGSDGFDYVFGLVDGSLLKFRADNPVGVAISPPGSAGHVRSFDFSNEKTIGATTRNGGVWRTDDGGGTWTAKNNGLACLQARSFRIISPTLMLVALRCSDRDEIYRSIDGGDTWTNTGDFGAGVYVNRFNSSFSSATRSFALTTSGLYQSESLGGAWFNSNSVEYRSAMPADADVHDDGSAVNAAGVRSEVAMVQNVGLYHIANTSQPHAAMTLTNAGLPAFKFGQRLSMINGTPHVPVSGYGLYAYENGSWTLKISERTLPEAVRVVQLANTPQKLYAATRYEGIWHSPDGGITWSPLYGSDCLFNWAERTFPQYFAPAGATSATFYSYYYRYYSGTSNYLTTSSADNHVWVLGPISGNRLLDLGPTTNFLPMAGCSQ